MESSRWVVVQTQPGRESWAAENVARQNHEFYLPRVLETGQRGTVRRLAAARPLFPRYLFVLVNGPWHFLASTFGCSGVIMAGSGPAFISNRVIDDLKSREDESGMIVLPQAGRMRRGQEVVITGKGALSGQRGIFDGTSSRDRSRILLDYLGHKTRVLIASDLLEAVA